MTDISIAHEDFSQHSRHSQDMIRKIQVPFRLSALLKKSTTDWDWYWCWVMVFRNRLLSIQVYFVESCLVCHNNNNIAWLQSDPQGRGFSNRLGSICIGKWNWLKNVNVNETESNLPVGNWNRFVMFVMVVCKTFSFQVRHTSEDVPRDLLKRCYLKVLLQWMGVTLTFNCI